MSLGLTFFVLVLSTIFLYDIVLFTVRIPFERSISSHLIATASAGLKPCLVKKKNMNLCLSGIALRIESCTSRLHHLIAGSGTDILGKIGFLSKISSASRVLKKFSTALMIFFCVFGASLS